jgi:hypothetical protein
MPFLQTYLCGRGHETEHLHMGQRGNAPDKLLCFHCLEASKKDAARLSEDPIADGFSSDLLTDEELRLRISKVMCEMSAEEVRFLPVEIRRAAIHRDSLYGISHQRGTLRMWRVRHNEEMMLFNHSILAFRVISAIFLSFINSPVFIKFTFGFITLRY